MPSIKKRNKKEYIFRCQHIGIFVRDLKKLSRFYINRLGFKLSKEFVVDKKMMHDIFGISSSCRIQYLTLDDFVVELFDFLDIKISSPTVEVAGYNHWAFIVKDKTAFCGDLKKKKIKVIRIAKPHGYTYFIKDPESNLIEIKEF